MTATTDRSVRTAGLISCACDRLAPDAEPFRSYHSCAAALLGRDVYTHMLPGLADQLRDLAVAELARRGVALEVDESGWPGAPIAVEDFMGWCAGIIAVLGEDVTVRA